MKGGERLAVPKPGPGTHKGSWEMAWGWAASWESSLSLPSAPRVSAVERDTSFTGSAGSVTLSPNPQHRFSLPHSPAPKGQLPRGTAAWLGEQPPRSAASGPLWLLRALLPQEVLRGQGSAQSFCLSCARPPQDTVPAGLGWWPDLDEGVLLTIADIPEFKAERVFPSTHPHLPDLRVAFVTPSLLSGVSFHPTFGG